MLVKKSITVFLICILSTLTFAQKPSEKEAAADNEKLRSEAVSFLRETLTDVNTMRTLENRITFTGELASLMWFYDEREARSMYGGVMNDFRDLLTRYDAMINAAGITVDDFSGGDGPSPFSFMMEATEKSRLLRKFSAALMVRQQLAMSVAEHDAELAFAFYNDSIGAISNPEFRKRADENSASFETTLIGQIAENNAAKAAQFGARSVAKGVTMQHVELLKKIHAKDPEKGVEFGAALLSKLKSAKLDGHDDYILSSLIEFAGKSLDDSRKQGGKRPVYSQAEIRDITEVLAQLLLNRSEKEGRSALRYADLVQKYSPGRAVQIRAKFRQANSNSNSAGPPSDYRSSANVARGRISNSNSVSSSNGMEEWKAREAEEQKLMSEVAGLDKKELSKEEREKFVAETRKIIGRTEGREKKVTALSLLATQVSKLGDKELASEIMRDAQALVTPTPKSYQDYLLTWMLISGYATTDPDRAFPLLEDTISRANETLAAFVKVAEFIDVAEDMVQDGEVQVGGFGGSMVRGLSRELNMADATIGVLAKADFGKMRSVTNRFERTEIRVLAKMMVLRVVLGPKETKKTEPILPFANVSDETIEN